MRGSARRVRPGWRQITICRDWRIRMKLARDHFRNTPLIYTEPGSDIVVTISSLHHPFYDGSVML